MPSAPDLARIYDEHAQALFAFVLNFTRSEDETREVLQEVFLKLARNPKILEAVKDERGFLLRLAHNVAVDLVRRRGVRSKYQEQFGAEFQAAFAPSPDPDQAAFRSELGRAMAELPAEQRAVLHLKLWEGLTFERVSAVLEIPMNTAASRYRYGLDKLRQLLRPFYEQVK
jgi:RNA polymerase sigma-70 factor (ECF subfamily)